MEHQAQQARRIQGQGVATDPDRTVSRIEIADPGRDLASKIPDLGLAVVQLDAGVTPQGRSEEVKNRCHPGRKAAARLSAETPGPPQGPPPSA